jgi:hypothetical protein
VNFGERGKSYGRHRWTLRVARGLAKPLTMGWPHKSVPSQIGSLGWFSEFFEARAQVDRGLTTVDNLTDY